MKKIPTKDEILKDCPGTNFDILNTQIRIAVSMLDAWNDDIVRYALREVKRRIDLQETDND